jgi:hypothetical protein
MLFILKSSGIWEKVDSKQSKVFALLQQKLNEIMILSSKNLHYPKEFKIDNDNLEIEIVRIENKSVYDLIMIVQYNKLTNGLRYLVYARVDSGNDASSLKSIDKNYLISFCPYDSDIAYFIE